MTVPKPHPYRLDPILEQTAALMAAARPSFWERIGHELDPELMGEKPAQLAVRAARAIAAELGHGPSSARLVLQRLRRWMADGKQTLEEVKEVNDMFDAIEDRGIPDEDDVVNELTPVLQRHIRDRAVHAAIEGFRVGGDLNKMVELEHKAQRVGKRRCQEVAIQRLSEVTRSAVKWLWPGRIPFGSLTVLDGDPGLGKSVLTLDVAARASTQRAMPDGECQTPACGVMLMSAEDGVAETVVPRLAAAGADLGRIHSVASLSIPGDLHVVERLAREHGVRLLVIDPLAAHLATHVDSHRDQQIRAALRPLAELAARLEIAVVMVRHLNKSGQSKALYRGGGSIGIVGAVRMGLLVAPDPADGDSRVLAVTKCNLVGRASSLKFKVVDGDGAPRIEWLGQSLHDADGLLVAPDERVSPAVDAARMFLKETLAGGPVQAQNLLADAASAGVAQRTLNRAKRELGVVSAKADGVWFWELPADAVATHGSG